VTIGLGFLCKDAVVLAADRQLTVQGYFKDHETKLHPVYHPNCRVVSTYAYLPSLANLLNDRVELDLKTLGEPHGEEIVEIITTHFKKLRKQYSAEMRAQQFLWAISTHAERARLLRISGGIIDEPQWACIGIGDSSLVRYMVSTLTTIPTPVLPSSEVLQLAVHIIQQAKLFVDGCGGTTDVALICDEGEEWNITTGDDVEKKLKPMQQAFQFLYNAWTNIDISDQERSNLLEGLGNFVKVNRQGLV
jgi:20S proteasome alpha/beta subunit